LLFYQNKIVNFERYSQASLAINCKRFRAKGIVDKNVLDAIKSQDTYFEFQF
jgi:hypothetical protein